MSDLPIRVLLIEDDEDDYVLTRQLLEAIRGIRFTLDWEASFSGGRAALHSNRHDVCLIDYRLGPQSGLELLREAIEAGCQAPLIVLTGQDDHQADLEAMKAGAVDYLIKGQINPSLLERSIRYAIARKRLERERLKNAELHEAILAKDRFLASISHELRTPLNSIIGFTGTLLMKLPGPLTPEQERQLKIVRSNSKHLLSMINNLLDVAKIDSGKVEISPEPIRLSKLQQEVVDSLLVLASSKGLKLESRPPAQDLVVRTDRRLLTQVLLNLTSNAIRYTETGGVRLESTRLPDSDPPRVAISVVDSGIGIKPEDQDKLFHAFVQVGGPRTYPQEGTGLGLYLSQKMAALLGGRIEFASEYGKGSTFTLEIADNSK